MLSAAKPHSERQFRDTRWEWGVASVLISLGLIGLRFVNDPKTWELLLHSGSEVHAPVGSLLRQKGGVRHRPLDATLWHDVSESTQKVATGDTVFTGADGVADLQLTGGSAEILPNSLVVVEGGEAPKRGLFGVVRTFFQGAQPSAVLAVNDGALHLSLKNRGESLDVRIRQKLYRISSESDAASAEVTAEAIRAQGSARLRVSEVREGEARESMEVREGEALMFTEKGVRVGRVPFVTASPVAASVVAGQPVAGGAVAVTFRWKWEDRSAKAFLEWKGTQNGVRDPGEDQSLSVELAEGAYRWRLVSRSQENPFASPWTDFRVVAMASPLPIGPREGTAFQSTGGSAPVIFSWQKAAPDLSAELELGVNSEAPRTFAGEPQGKELALSDGDYQWRTRVKDSSGQVSPWSEPRHFSVHAQLAAIALAPVPVAPVTVAPPVVVAAPKPKPVVKAPAKIVKPDIVILPTLESADASASNRIRSASDLNHLTVALRWKAIPGVKGYEVRIFKSGVRIQTLLSKDPTLVLSLTSFEQYAYQVATVLPSGKSIESNQVPIRLQVLPPVLGVPKAGSVQPLSRELLMTWEKTSLTEFYRVQVSMQKDFSRPMVDEKLQENFFAILPKQMGLYFWRVKSVSHGHESDWTPSGTFTVK
ncbi:MAG: hypothetical protein ACXVBW_13415 [Bdellovibrionota bacterium]